MSKKIIFLDVDGTLVGFKDGIQTTPQSAINAVQQARKNGHLIYLCTGRSKAELDDKLMKIGFDGVIGAGGGFVESEGKMIFHKTLPSKDVNIILDYFNKHHVAYYLESNSGLYANEDYINHMIQDFYGGVKPEGENEFLALMQPFQNADLDDINKISFISEELSFDEIHDYFHDEYHLVKASWTDDTSKTYGEISNLGINKATAIHFLLDHLGLDIKDTYAFGDSMNDVEMFQCVNTSIAMGNSLHDVKEFANFITKDLYDDGIEFGMKNFNLI